MLSIQKSIKIKPLYWKGPLSYFTGVVYTGNFKDCMRDGKGTYTFNNGKKYVGEFKNSTFHGNGIMYYSDGSIAQEGTWKNGEFAGQGSTEN